MRHEKLSVLVRECDRLLDPRRFEDWPGAVNGLQVENDGKVTRIAAAVDASLATVRMAAAAGADLMVVHHGLFWAPTHPWTGNRHALLLELIKNNIAIYSAHLPLDAHPELGNNVQLARLLGLKKQRPFFEIKGEKIGFRGERTLSRLELGAVLEKVCASKVVILAGGTEKCRKIGVVTGGAGDEMAKAAAEGVDTFITGEGRHWTHALAEDLGLNVFYAGHYATEIFGVKALAQHLSRKFELPWSFLDHPSGL